MHSIVRAVLVFLVVYVIITILMAIASHYMNKSMKRLPDYFAGLMKDDYAYRSFSVALSQYISAVKSKTKLTDVSVAIITPTALPYYWRQEVAKLRKLCSVSIVKENESADTTDANIIIAIDYDGYNHNSRSILSSFSPEPHQLVLVDCTFTAYYEETMFPHTSYDLLYHASAATRGDVKKTYIRTMLPLKRVLDWSYSEEAQAQALVNKYRQQVDEVSKNGQYNGLPLFIDVSMPQDVLNQLRKRIPSKCIIESGQDQFTVDIRTYTSDCKQSLASTVPILGAL